MELNTIPLSYDAAPCELFFAKLKDGDLNPQKVTTGKKSFNKVVALIYNNIKWIPRYKIVLFHRHTSSKLLEYLKL